jgi:predicted nucleic acid-binding Zn ribbon protein
MQKISDAPLTRCPSCGKKRLKKLVSAPVFRLKGAGWYETDFKSDKEGKRNLAAADREEPKAETKPDPKDGKSEAKAGKPEAKDAKPEPSKPAATAVSASKAKAPKSRARRSARPRRR